MVYFKMLPAVEEAVIAVTAHQACRIHAGFFEGMRDQNVDMVRIYNIIQTSRVKHWFGYSSIQSTMFYHVHLKMINKPHSDYRIWGTFGFFTQKHGDKDKTSTLHRQRTKVRYNYNSWNSSLDRQLLKSR